MILPVNQPESRSCFGFESRRNRQRRFENTAAQGQTTLCVHSMMDFDMACTKAWLPPDLGTCRSWSSRNTSSMESHLDVPDGKFLCTSTRI